MRNSSSEPISLKHMSGSLRGSSSSYSTGASGTLNSLLRGSSCGYLPGAAGAQNSPLRESSCSPPRARIPDCGKMKLVAVGNRFCLTKLDPGDKLQPAQGSTLSGNNRPSGHISITSTTGAKPPPASQHQTTWQISLRSRSSSDERSVLRRTESGEEPDKRTISKDSNNIKKAYLKENTVPKIKERIISLQDSFSSSRSKVSTMPWSRNLQPNSPDSQKLRKTSSSPCLFIKQTAMKLSQNKPIKLFPNSSRAIETKLSQVVTEEIKFRERTQHAPRTVVEISELSDERRRIKSYSVGPWGPNDQNSLRSRTEVQDPAPRRGEIRPNTDVQISQPRYEVHEKDVDRVSRNDICKLTDIAPHTLHTNRAERRVERVNSSQIAVSCTSTLLPVSVSPPTHLPVSVSPPTHLPVSSTSPTQPTPSYTFDSHSNLPSSEDIYSNSYSPPSIQPGLSSPHLPHASPSCPTLAHHSTSSRPTPGHHSNPSSPSSGHHSTPSRPTPGNHCNPSRPSSGHHSTPSCPNPGHHSTPSCPTPGHHSTPSRPTPGHHSTPDRFSNNNLIHSHSSPTYPYNLALSYSNLDPDRSHPINETGCFKPQNIDETEYENIEVQDTRNTSSNKKEYDSVIILDSPRKPLYPITLFDQEPSKGAKVCPEEDLSSRRGDNSDTTSISGLPFRRAFSLNPEQNFEPLFYQVQLSESEKESIPELEERRKRSLTAEDYYQIASRYSCKSSRNSSIECLDEAQGSVYRAERRVKDKNRHFKVNSHYEDYEDFLVNTSLQFPEDVPTQTKDIGSVQFSENILGPFKDFVSVQLSEGVLATAKDYGPIHPYEDVLTPAKDLQSVKISGDIFISMKDSESEQIPLKSLKDSESSSDVYPGFSIHQGSGLRRESDDIILKRPVDYKTENRRDKMSSSDLIYSEPEKNTFSSLLREDGETLEPEDVTRSKKYTSVIRNSYPKPFIRNNYNQIQQVGDYKNQKAYGYNSNPDQTLNQNPTSNELKQSQTRLQCMDSTRLQPQGAGCFPVQESTRSKILDCIDYQDSIRSLESDNFQYHNSTRERDSNYLQDHNSINQSQGSYYLHQDQNFTKPLGSNKLQDNSITELQGSSYLQAHSFTQSQGSNYVQDHSFTESLGSNDQWDHKSLKAQGSSELLDLSSTQSQGSSKHQDLSFTQLQGANVLQDNNISESQVSNNHRDNIFTPSSGSNNLQNTALYQGSNILPYQYPTPSHEKDTLLFQVSKSSSGASEFSEDEEIRKELQSILGNSQNFPIKTSQSLNYQKDDINISNILQSGQNLSTAENNFSLKKLSKKKDIEKRSLTVTAGERSGEEKGSVTQHTLQNQSNFSASNSRLNNNSDFCDFIPVNAVTESYSFYQQNNSLEKNIYTDKEEGRESIRRESSIKEWSPGLRSVRETCPGYTGSRESSPEEDSVETRGFREPSESPSSETETSRRLRFRNPRERRNSIPEREIDTEDTDNAVLQLNLRKISGKHLVHPDVQNLNPNPSNLNPNQEKDNEKEENEDEEDDDEPPGLGIITVSPFCSDGEESDEEIEDLTREPLNKNRNPEEDEELDEVNLLEKLQSLDLSGNVLQPWQPILSSMKDTKKGIFRLGRIKLRGNKPGLRRSRSWQGFGSGLRYESVSDAGLPPPPSHPPAMTPSNQQTSSPVRATRQSHYRPLSNSEFGPKCSAFPPPSLSSSSFPVVRSQSEGNVLRSSTQDEDIEYECVVTCKVRRRGEDDMSSLVPHPLPPGRDDLTEQEINHLMSVIANMESVKGVGGREEEKQSPPPTDDELREFIDYVGMGVVNQDRVDYEEQRQDEGQPEPPKRSKQANQYFWRRHYLSIIQEEEEHADQSQGSSRANSRPASTYENNMFRMPRILSISPLCTVEQRGREEKRDSRESWESEMSVESLTSINSILSEEGSITSSGSFQSDTCQEKSNSRDTEGGRRAYESLSCLLDSVPPPSNTPDSMVIDPSISKPCLSEINPVSRIRTGMGSRFKQQLQEIEERKLNEDEDENDGREGNTNARFRKDSFSESGEGRRTSPTGDRTQERSSEGEGSRTPTRNRNNAEKKEINSVQSTQETRQGLAGGPGVKSEPGPNLRVPSVSRSQRKNLTISTLIAECEEYVQTDRFTQDLSSNLVTLFKGGTGKVGTDSSNNNPVKQSQEKKIESEGGGKPPKIPQNMRLKPIVDRAEKVEKVGLGKFPGLRESVYDNVESDIEDEGIDNYYSDDSGTPPKICRGVRHESSPAQYSEGYDSAQESERRGRCENQTTKEKNVEKNSHLNPFLNPQDSQGSNPFEEDLRSLNPFENLSPDPQFKPSKTNNPFENDLSTPRNPFEESFESSSVMTDSCDSIGDPETLQENFEDYESMMSDIEETLSILSRNSRSTTPASDLFNSRTPTPSFGQFSSYSTSDLSVRIPRSVSDKHVIPVVSVFDDLKDYLSDSDLSLDYMISMQRRKHKKQKNLNKQAQLANFITSKKSTREEQEIPKSAEKDKKVELQYLEKSSSFLTKIRNDTNCAERKDSATEAFRPSYGGSKPQSKISESFTVPEKCVNETNSHRSFTTESYQDGTNSLERMINDTGSNKLTASRDILHRRQSKSPTPHRDPCLEPIPELEEKTRLVASYFAEEKNSQDQLYPGQTGSLKRRKDARTASLTSLLNSKSAETNEAEQATFISPANPSHPSLCSTPEKGPFTRTFQLFQQKPVISRVAVNKSVLSIRPFRKENSVPPNITENSSYTSFPSSNRSWDGNLRSSASESKLNTLLNSPLHAPDTAFSDKGLQGLDAELQYETETESRIGVDNQECSSESRERSNSTQSLHSFSRQLAEDRMQKIREMRNQFLGIETKGSVSLWNSENSGSNGIGSRNLRSQSLEPETTKLGSFSWNLTPKPYSSGFYESTEQGLMTRQNSESVSLADIKSIRPAPASNEGLFHAVPVRVNSSGSDDSSPDEGEEKVEEEDEDEDEDDDDEDARTVIYKSPFSSPGLVLSRSASLTMTPLSYSPRCTPLPPFSVNLPPIPSSSFPSSVSLPPVAPVRPASCDPNGVSSSLDSPSPSPPPRPPPPTNYIPSYDHFASLPRNWKTKLPFKTT